MTLSENFHKDMTKKYKEQCVEFLDNFSEIEGVNVLSTEKNFNLLVKIKDKKIILNGFIDIIGKDKNNCYYVIDWKSKSKFKNKVEVKEYARQLYLYSIYIKYKYGEFPKELWFYQFRINHIEKIEFNQEELDETLDWVYNTVKMIDEENFFLPIDFKNFDNKTELNNAKFFCMNLCDYSDICQYWR